MRLSQRLELLGLFCCLSLRSTDSMLLQRATARGTPFLLHMQINTQYTELVQVQHTISDQRVRWKSKGHELEKSGTINT